MQRLFLNKTLFIILCSVLIHTFVSEQNVFAQGQKSTPFLFSQDISSPYVTAFAEDKEGFIWIGTNHGLNRYNGTFYDVHYTYSNEFGLNNDNVISLLEDESGDLWMLTEAGLSVRRDGRFYHFGQSGFAPAWQLVDVNKDYLLIADNRGVDKINKKDLTVAYHYKSLKVGFPKPIGVSGSGCVLMARENDGLDQIVLLDEQLREIGTLNFPSPTVVNKIISDADGSNWIVTKESLYYVSPENLIDPNEIRNNQTSINLQTSFLDFCLGENVLFLCEYDKDNLLIGLQGEGLFLIDKRSAKMKPIHHSEKLQEAKCVCFVDSHRNIWLSSGSKGFRLLSPEMEYEHIYFTEDIDSNFKRLCLDTQGRLWLRSSSDIVCYDPETREYESFATPNTFYGDIFVDSAGRLWVIEQYNQIKCYEISKSAESRVGVKLLICKHYKLDDSVFSISEDSEGKIWLSLADRFAVIDYEGRLNYEEGPFKVNFTSLQNTHGAERRMFLYTVGQGIFEYKQDNRFQPIGIEVPSTRIVYADERKNLWIGSSNRGLVQYNEQTKQTEYLQERMEMGAYDIKAIEEDALGNIWFSTSTMLFRYNPQDSSIVSLHDDDLRDGIVYNLYASAKDNQGRMYFGGMDGITIVDPIGLKYKKKEIPIKVEDIVISGSELYEYDGKPFELKHYETSVVFWFSGLDFSLGKQLSYEYKLEGYDKTWLPVGHQTRISYSQLPAGSYNLKIRVKSLYGISTAGELSVPFSVKPAPWLTIWAKLLYIIILIVLVYIGLKLLIHRRVREERYALLQQRESVNHRFVEFVSNISHEFRTPLSMMYAPLVEFVSGKTFEGRDKDLIDLIKRNTDRLRDLTEQVLSVGKGQDQDKKLKVMAQDIVPYINVIFDNFRYPAEEKNLSLQFKSPDSLECAIDNEKIARILGNLLSNAIKYTPSNGEITLEISKKNDKVTISVIDTGIGVPKEREKDMFKRLERLDMENRDPKITGTGIGLYYSKYLAELHKGTLEYTANEPKGSCFTLSLSLDNSVYSAEEILNPDLIPNVVSALKTENSAEKDKVGSLMIVEDNRDVIRFLQLCFGSRYNIYISTNGAEALDSLSTYVPDLIISDAMMPVMDGRELCRRIKESPEFCHIPVILMSAISDQNKDVEMIKTGADALVKKPFDPRQLAAMVEGMIENRRRVQRKISALTSSTLADAIALEEDKVKESENVISPADLKFLEHFYSELDAHLADESYGVDEMAQAMGMGNTKLHSKIKTLTGQTPKAFFVTYRMNKAMELLKSGQYTVSEVGYMVGATSPAVFSRSFKHQFGISPSAVCG